MPCTNCMAEYSRMRKEHGCSKCAFSFCAKCVSKKFVIPVLSPKPVSVCDNCYNNLTSKSSGNEPNATSSKDRTKSTNWWGDDRLPPPSMRAQYVAERQKSTVAVPRPRPTVANIQAAGTDWDSLEKRLEDLTRDMPSLTSGTPTASTSGKEAAENVSLAEIEERLAALKNVPVELIRNPRLRINDPNIDDSGDDAFVDEAEQLIAAAEARAKIERRQDGGYYNEGLQIDDDDKDVLKSACGAAHRNNRSSESSSDGAAGSSLSSSARTSDSSVLRQTINNALNAPSLRSSDVEDAFQPNFVECIEQTVKDAKTAEQHALEFIRSSQDEEQTHYAKQSQHIKDNNHQNDSQQIQKSLRVDDQSWSTGHKSDEVTSSPSKKVTSPSRVKNFFQRFKK